MLRATRRIRCAWGPLADTAHRSHSAASCRSVCSKQVESDERALIDKEEFQAGRDLAKLATMARGAADAIRNGTEEIELAPNLHVHMEQEIAEANRIVRDALNNVGRPCTVDELADRVNSNVVPIPMGALGYKSLLRAEYLRDSLERFMVQVNVLPPKEAWVDGSGKPFSRLARKEQKRKELLGKIGLGDSTPSTNDEAAEQNTGVHTVPEAELKRRKADMESATKLSFVLQGFDTALIEVGRTHKVVKGGTNLSMRALVVIGDKKGTAGYGEGKSKTAAHAIERACRDARRNLLKINLYQDRTIHHRVKGKYVKSLVSLWPAPPGSGISANNNFSAIFQLFGLKDIGAKLHGPRCLTNAVKALFNALSRVYTAEEIAATRGLQIISRDEFAPRRTRQKAVSQL